MFDLEALKQRAGHQCFLQGQKLAEQGCVSRLAVVGEYVTATVSGREDYHVSLSKGASDQTPGSAITNHCSCPAAAYQDVCKHCVALAMALETYEEPLPDINAQTRLLRDHLLALPNDQLVDMVMAPITNNPREWDKWQLKLALDNKSQQSGEACSLEKLQNLLCKALPEEQLWDWQEVRDYFEDADAQFEAIFAASKNLAVDEQWQFCLVAIKRLNLVLEQIDDSNGERFFIEGQLNEKLGSLFEHLSWSDDKKAQWLVDSLAGSSFDVFPCVPEDFSFSTEVETLFLAQCAERVQLLGNELNKDDFEQSYPVSRLLRPLISRAQQTGDWQEHCRLLALTARNHRDYLRISQICLDQDEALEAEGWLCQAKKRCSSEYDQRACAEHEVKVCIALGEHNIAWKKAWQLFCQSPDFTDYLRLEKLHQELGEPEPDFLSAVEQVLAEVCETPSIGAWQSNDSVLAFYLYHQQVDKARAWAKSHLASETNLIKLAKQTVLLHPEESMALFHRVLKVVIGQTNNGAYQQALDLLLEIKTLIASGKESDVAEHALNTMVAKLVREFKAKRNMMKLLREHFAHCFS